MVCMRYSVIILVLLLLTINLITVSAIRPSASTSSGFTLEKELPVSASGPSFKLEVHYSDGTSTYEGDRIPGSITVPVGTRVRLSVNVIVNKPGTYRIGSSAVSLTDLPSNDYISCSSGSSSSKIDGHLDSSATVVINKYYNGLAARLTVEYRAITGQEGTTISKTVIVRVSTPIITGTPIFPNTITSSTQSEAETTSSTSTTSPSTSSSASPTATSRNTQSGASTVHWHTGTTETRELSIRPSELEVNAGETAVFSLCSNLEYPKFRIEGLPTGYRYVITSDEECYRLKIFTHPLSYGKFDMSVVVSSGGVEERAPISLKVRKIKTTSAGTMTSPISTTGLSQSSPKVLSETGTSETSVPSGAESRAAASPSTGSIPMESTQTLVTVKEVLAAIAAVLGLVLLLLLLRRR